MNSIEKCKKIYRDSFETYGDDARSVRWDKKTIETRYKELLKVGELNESSVLEIGCGIGGFYEYITQKNQIVLGTYLGIDLIEGMIDLAKQKYPEAFWEKRNIFNEPLEDQFDYVFLCGVFNLAGEDCQNYMEKMLLQAFSYCKKGLAFNFISSNVNFKDEEMSYYDPVDVFDFCIKNLSWKVDIHHHYSKCDVSVFIYR